MLTGSDSAKRVETWLRSKQVELNGEVLIITGRGAGSFAGVPVVKEATRKVLNRLRRQGVVEAFAEDTPGSFVATLAPLRALLEAPRRRGTPPPVPHKGRSTIAGLRAEVQERLHYLASRSLDALGVSNASEKQIASEMERQFSMISRTVPASVDPDSWIDQAVNRALQEYADTDR
ncbi:MAG TPA: hypothetical protein VFZ73_11190 [Gemmatimonadaceae bacterium]